jgi:hypothetical protein
MSLLKGKKQRETDPGCGNLSYWIYGRAALRAVIKEGHSVPCIGPRPVPREQLEKFS